MLRPKSGPAAFVTLSFALLVLGLTARSVIADEAEKPRDLRQERLDALHKVVEYAEKGFQTARATYEEVIQANIELLNAQLEYCESNQERIEILKQYLGELKKAEELAQARVHAGRGSDKEVQQAKAERLRVEIELQKVEAKENQGVQFEGGQPDPVIIAKQQVAIKSAELRMAQAQVAISVAKSETLKALVTEAAAAESVEEQKMKNAKQLFEKNVVSSGEVALRNSEHAAAKARRAAAESEVAESRAQIQFNQAHAELAELELALAEMHLNALITPER
ncbi:hypothetical protein GC197_10910 [bacterium]|nr:hypothetical protein [bacterium]